MRLGDTVGQLRYFAPTKQMQLRATVSASANSDNKDGVAYIYCHDPKQNYCFSLARAVDSDDIEVMVVDQVLCCVDQLKVVFHATGFMATLSMEVASLLDGHPEYDIEFLPGDWSRKTVEEALIEIFRGKRGLSWGG